MESSPCRICLVTPSFNQGQYIAETIDSVLAQQGNFDLDYLIIDGGSSDETLSILENYSAKISAADFRPNCRNLSFRWISEPDRGQSAAINKGFRLGSGEILNWLCSDDCLLPGALQHVTDFFSTHPQAGILFANAETMTEMGRVNGTMEVRPFSREDLIRKWDRASVQFRISQPAAFFRRCLFDSLGGLNENNHLCMDYEFYLAASRGQHLPTSSAFLARARYYDTCKSIRFARRQFLEGIAVSKREWNENFWKYRLGFWLHRPLIELYFLSAKLRKTHPGYEKLLNLVKKGRERTASGNFD